VSTSCKFNYDDLIYKR